MRTCHPIADLIDAICAPRRPPTKWERVKEWASYLLVTGVVLSFLFFSCLGAGVSFHLLLEWIW